MMIDCIRPSADLRNHYSELSKRCHETQQPIAITVNGREDTVVLSFQQYKQLVAELELLRTLSAAEEDVQYDRVAPIEDTFQDLRKSLQEGLK